MSEITLTLEDLTVGAHIEYTALGGLLSDDEVFAGEITDVWTETVERASGDDDERTKLEITDAEGETHEVAAHILINQKHHESDNSGFRVDSFEPADESEDDEQELVTDGGMTEKEIGELTAHISDKDIRRGIDGEHIDDVDAVREALAVVQKSTEETWAEHMDGIEDGHYSLVEDADDIIVLSAESVEYDLYLEPAGLDSRDMVEAVSAAMHQIARKYTAFDWGYSYPLVVMKPDTSRAGEAYVQGVINGLLNRGLSPGQAWAYWGVEIQGYSRNGWASRCGYADHSTVSEALRKAKEKLPTQGI